MYIPWGGSRIPLSLLYHLSWLLLLCSCLPLLPWLAVAWTCPVVLREGLGRQSLFPTNEQRGRVKDLDPGGPHRVLLSCKTTLWETPAHQVSRPCPFLTWFCHSFRQYFPGFKWAWHLSLDETVSSYDPSGDVRLSPSSTPTYCIRISEQKLSWHKQFTKSHMCLSCKPWAHRLSTVRESSPFLPIASTTDTLTSCRMFPGGWGTCCW